MLRASETPEEQRGAVASLGGSLQCPANARPELAARQAKHATNLGVANNPSRAEYLRLIRDGGSAADNGVPGDDGGIRHRRFIYDPGAVENTRVTANDGVRAHERRR